MARTGIVARIVVSGSVVYRRAPTLHPLSLHPTLSPTARPIPPRNRETSKLHARKAVSCYLLDSRVATAPPCARKHCETSADGKTAREREREASVYFLTKTRGPRLAPRKTHRPAAAISAAANRRMPIAHTCCMPQFLMQLAICIISEI